MVFNGTFYLIGRNEKSWLSISQVHTDYKNTPIKLQLEPLSWMKIRLRNVIIHNLEYYSSKSKIGKNLYFFCKIPAGRIFQTKQIFAFGLLQN